jgi:hypothetical protein
VASKEGGPPVRDTSSLFAYMCDPSNYHSACARLSSGKAPRNIP